jgi:hypothetical protein
MKRPAKATHKPHISRTADPADPAGEVGATSGTGVVGIAARCPAQASERVFAAVRPGFVAPCMVKAAGRTDGPFGDPRGLVWPALAAVPTCLPNTTNPSRATRPGPRPRGLMAGDPDVSYRASRNRQREYLAESRGTVRLGAGRFATITARESTDAQDLRLATLSSRMHVRSNIFKFVVT